MGIDNKMPTFCLWSVDHINKKEGQKVEKIEVLRNSALVKICLSLLTLVTYNS